MGISSIVISDGETFGYEENTIALILQVTVKKSDTIDEEKLQAWTEDLNAKLQNKHVDMKVDVRQDDDEEDDEDDNDYVNNQFQFTFVFNKTDPGVGVGLGLLSQIGQTSQNSQNSRGQVSRRRIRSHIKQAIEHITKANWWKQGADVDDDGSLFTDDLNEICTTFDVSDQIAQISHISAN